MIIHARLTDRAKEGYTEVVNVDDPPRDGSDVEERAKRVSRALWLAFTIFAVAFVGDSTYQITKGVFGWESRGERANAECAAGIRTLETAVRDGRIRSLKYAEEHAALTEFENAKKDAWQKRADVESACGADDPSRVAFAALLRIDRAEEAAIRQRARTVTAPEHDLRALVP